MPDLIAAEREAIAVTPALYVNASPEARYLYDAHLRGTPLSVVAAEVSVLKGRSISAETAAEAMKRVVARIEALSKHGPVRSPLQLFALPIIPPRLVSAIASVLAAAFQPVATVLLIVLSLVAIGLSFWFADHAARPRAADWLAIYAIYIATGVVHEFGHAAACRRFGLEPRSIGLTAYLFLPAFYSDVSATWLVRPLQRVVIDLGGVLLQLVALGAIACVALATDSALLRQVEILVITSMAINLAPVFRFDGYWALADALDVPDLEKRAFRALGAVLRRRPTGFSGGKGAAVLGFAVFNVAVWCYVTWLSLLFVLTGPQRIVASLMHLTAGQITFASVWPSILTLVFVVLAGFGLFRIAGIVVRFLASAMKVSRAASNV